MVTSSNGNIFRVTGNLCGEFTGDRWIPTQRPVTRSFDVFFICAQMTGWVNYLEAGYLRRHRAHYDATIMSYHRCTLPGATWHPTTKVTLTFTLLWLLRWPLKRVVLSFRTNIRVSGSRHGPVRPFEFWYRNWWRQSCSNQYWLHCVCWTFMASRGYGYRSQGKIWI